MLNLTAGLWAILRVLQEPVCPHHGDLPHDGGPAHGQHSNVYDEKVGILKNCEYILTHVNRPPPDPSSYLMELDPSGRCIYVTLLLTSDIFNNHEES